MDSEELFRRIGENLTVGRAFGPSYEVGGTTVIPVAIVGGGGGGGEGRQTKKANGGEESEPQEGSGGGFGGVVYPLGAYVVQGDSVRFVPTFDVTRLVGGFLVLLRLLTKRSRRRKSK